MVVHAFKRCNCNQVFVFVLRLTDSQNIAWLIHQRCCNATANNQCRQSWGVSHQRVNRRKCYISFSIMAVGLAFLNSATTFLIKRDEAFREPLAHAVGKMHLKSRQEDKLLEQGSFRVHRRTLLVCQKLFDHQIFEHVIVRIWLTGSHNATQIQRGSPPCGASFEV